MTKLRLFTADIYYVLVHHSHSLYVAIMCDISGLLMVKQACIHNVYYMTVKLHICVFNADASVGVHIISAPCFNQQCCTSFCKGLQLV